MFFAVKRHVLPKTVLTSVLPIALCALEGFRSVKLHVGIKVPLPREGFRTFGTAELTFLRMTGQHMSFHARLVGGGIFA